MSSHLESTVFFASLIKVCLIFKNETIPPNVNLVNPNLKIRWDGYHLETALEPTPLTSRSDCSRLMSCHLGIASARPRPFSHQVQLSCPLHRWRALSEGRTVDIRLSN